MTSSILLALILSLVDTDCAHAIGAVMVRNPDVKTNTQEDDKKPADDDEKKQRAAIDCSKIQAAASKSEVDDCQAAKSAYPSCDIACPVKRDDPHNIIIPPNPTPNPKPVPTPTPSPRPVYRPQNENERGRQEQIEPEDATANAGSGGSVASNNESADLRQCASLRSAAESACNYIEDSESASDSKSLNSTCEQGASKGMKNSKSKTTAATECSTKFGQCKQTCSEFAQTYSESDNFDTFNSNARACLALSSKAEAMNESSSSSLDFAQSSMNCSNSSSESPQSASGSDSNSNSSSTPKSAATQSACAANPTSPGCDSSSTQTQSSQALEASGGLGDASIKKGSADVGDTSGASVNSPFGNVDGSGGATAAAPKNGTIANNSGGSIPGVGGAKPGSGGYLQAALKSVSSVITEIEKGFRGGGASTPTPTEKAGGSEGSGNGAQDSKRRDLASDGGPLQGIDLRRYLPGGDLAPKPIPREIRDQIYGPGADLFERIHIRYDLKCRLGLLYDCPQ